MRSAGITSLFGLRGAHDSPKNPYEPLDAEGASAACCLSSRAGGTERHAKALQDDAHLAAELVELIKNAPGPPSLRLRLLAKTDRSLRATLYLQGAVRQYQYRKQTEEKRARLFRPPSLRAALDHRDYHLPVIREEGQLSRLLPLCCSLRTIREHAHPDVALQIKLVRCLMLLMALLSFQTYSQIQRNLAGDDLHTSDIFQRMSLGNRKDFTVTALTMGEETLTSLFLLCFMIVAHYVFKRQWKRSHERTVGPEDFTVWVRGLPQVTTTKKAEAQRALVAEEASAWGKVARVALPRSARAGTLNLYDAFLKLQALQAEERQAFAVYYDVKQGDAAKRLMVLRHMTWLGVARASKAMHQVEYTLSKKHVGWLDAAAPRKQGERRTGPCFASTGDAFVTFETAAHAIAFREARPTLPESGGTVAGKEMPAPSNVYWPQWGEKFGLGARLRFEAKCLCVILPSLCAILAVTYGQTFLNLNDCSSAALSALEALQEAGHRGPLCAVVNQLMGIVPGVAYGVIFGVLPGVVQRSAVHWTYSGKVNSIAVRLVVFWTINMLLTPLGFLALVSDFSFSHVWYEYASGPTILGMIIGQILIQFLLATVEIFFTLPQAYVTAVLSCGCQGVPRFYARLKAAFPCLSGLLGAVPVLGNFPLDREATYGYFLVDFPFYLGLRAAELSVPFLIAIPFGPAFPILYPLALVALGIGELQDRIKVLRRLKRLPKQENDDLLQLVTGVVFPLGLLARMALLQPLYSQKLDHDLGTRDELALLTKVGGVVCLLLLALNVADLTGSPIKKPLSLEQLEAISRRMATKVAEEAGKAQSALNSAVKDVAPLNSVRQGAGWAFGHLGSISHRVGKTTAQAVEAASGLDLEDGHVAYSMSYTQLETARKAEGRPTYEPPLPPRVVEQLKMGHYERKATPVAQGLMARAATFVSG